MVGQENWEQLREDKQHYSMQKLAKIGRFVWDVSNIIDHSMKDKNELFLYFSTRWVVIWYVIIFREIQGQFSWLMAEQGKAPWSTSRA